MQSQLVFQEKKERERLRRQNLLLSQAEKPALEHFFKGKSELSVLDIGCNDGARTFHRFSDDRISRVIGLEYNQQLVERANSQYGNTKFSFYQMDVDRDSFSAAFPHHANALIQKKDRSDQILCLPVPCIASENPRKTNPDPLWLQMKRIFLDSFWIS